uniref:Cupin type-1 domain-containing protein n=1 Tax=Kalanchoe fedtschenkoi TaxID=63787 RepID=A0A7N0V5M8_KALFE
MCEESYQSGSSQHGSSRWSRGGESRRWKGEGQTGRINDQHQKIRNFRQGDIIALPAGVSHWIYNDGQTPIVAITIFDTSNDANLLDQSIRKFFLAGSSQRQQEMRGRHEGSRCQQGRGPWKGQGQQGEQSENWQSVFSRFDEELQSDLFNVNREVIRSLQGQNEQRGGNILVREPLEFLTAAREEQEYSHGRQHGY